MLLPEYQIYVNETIQLVGSLFIKSEQTAQAINRQLIGLGQKVDLTNPATWKYYLNATGAYYVSRDVGTNAINIALSDKPIMVRDIDKNYPKIHLVKLTTDLHLTNPLTVANLLKRQDDYDELIEQYPMQSVLIDGILNANNNNQKALINKYNTADHMTIILDALDFTILYYDDAYLKDYEDNVISKIQAHIYNYDIRWNVRNFSISDRLYTSVMWSNLTLAIVEKIINIRLENINTDKIHDFYLDMFLSGYFNLRDYVKEIPRPYKLFLKQNIGFIVAHGGKNKLLELLNNVLLFPNGINLYNYVLQNDFTIGENARSIKIVKNGLSDGVGSVTSGVDELVEVTTPLASQNKKLESVQKEILSVAPYNTYANIIKTNVIEINPIASVTSVMFNMAEEKLNYWFYLTTPDKTYVQFLYFLTVPGTSISNLRLTPSDVSRLLIYIKLRLSGFSETESFDYRIRSGHLLPWYNAEGILVRSPATVDGILQQGNPLHGHLNYIKDHIDAVQPDNFVNEDTTVGLVITEVGDFVNYVEKVVNAKYALVLTKNITSNIIHRGQIDGYVRRHFSYQQCEYGPGLTVRRFGENINVLLEELSVDSLKFILKDILKTCVGIDETTFNPNNWITRLLSDVSSYESAYVNGFKKNDFYNIDDDGSGFAGVNRDGGRATPSKTNTPCIPDVTITSTLQQGGGYEIVFEETSYLSTNGIKIATVLDPTPDPNILNTSANNIIFSLDDAIIFKLGA